MTKKDNKFIGDLVIAIVAGSTPSITQYLLFLLKTRSQPIVKEVSPPSIIALPEAVFDHNTLPSIDSSTRINSPPRADLRSNRIDIKKHEEVEAQPNLITPEVTIRKEGGSNISLILGLFIGITVLFIRRFSR